MSNNTIIVAGDAETTRLLLRKSPRFRARYMASEAARSIEVPCQKCGRPSLLAPSGQRSALGMGEPMVEVHSFAPLVTGKTSTQDTPMAVLCQWCAFAGHPELIAALDAALEQARK